MLTFRESIFSLDVVGEKKKTNGSLVTEEKKRKKKKKVRVKKEDGLQRGVSNMDAGRLRNPEMDVSLLKSRMEPVEVCCLSY